MSFSPRRAVLDDESSVEVIRDYNEADYRTVWQKPEAIFSRPFEENLVRRLLPPDPGGWFVDICAGFGRLYPLYAAPGRKVVMVDYAANLIDLASRSLRDRGDVSFVLANAYHLPFRSEVFSGGISLRAFHHMSAPEMFLGECARVLRVDAHVVLSYSNKRNLLRSLRHPRTALRNDHEEYPDVHFGTHPHRFAEMAFAAGFDVGETLGTGFLSRFVSERTRSLSRLLAPAESALDALCGTHNLAPMNFVDLVKAPSVPSPGGATAPGTVLSYLFQCPACAGEVADDAEGMHCEACGRVYPLNGAVLDFRYPDRGGAE